MDFAGVDAWLRTAVFVGLLASCACLAWWANANALEPSWRRMISAAGTLAAIPAVVAAPFESGETLVMLGAIAVAGFADCAVAVVPALLPGRTPPAAISTAARPGAAYAPASPGESRVGTFESVTAVNQQPLSEQTLALGVGGRVAEIAYLIEYSREGRPHRLGETTTIGRSPKAGIVLDREDVSREHAVVKLEDKRFVLYDLGATNGTRLARAGRRRQVTTPTPLAELDTIEIGGARLVYIEVR